ncbi:SURF1 family protein [Phenylobacterium soli]|uniref:SURF1-like protein n=1 Tax=Phenylobacterium soli TaxID=2170551 RepID=A0A328AMS6_9CAUL|nr:SURF1 family protein [Phenylobacterium soli]RAK55691.1 SURF1 family protein [Phenylobacterium soli]
MARGRGRRVVASIAAVLAFALLCALGTWQLERRAWKLDLIARVDARVHAAPAPAPGPADWPAVSAARDEYRRVRVAGMFLNDKETLAQAVTELGPGYWVMTPLRTEGGFTVLVNRGFVPADLNDPAARVRGQISGATTVTGLMRMSEPHGGFLRANRPAEDRWYSRDVAAIAAAKHLGPVAPYFIDADATPNTGGWPRGGLTVISFRNSHLSYALTWFGLAAMVAAWAGWAMLDKRRPKPASPPRDDPDR